MGKQASLNWMLKQKSNFDASNFYEQARNKEVSVLFMNETCTHRQHLTHSQDQRWTSRIGRTGRQPGGMGGQTNELAESTIKSFYYDYLGFRHVLIVSRFNSLHVLVF